MLEADSERICGVTEDFPDFAGDANGIGVDVVNPVEVSCDPTTKTVGQGVWDGV